MRVLVTGAAGFIGRHLVEDLVEAGHDVVAVTRTCRDLGTEASRSLLVVEADLHDNDQVSRLFAGLSVDAAVHLAWFAKPADYLHDTWHNIVSLESTLSLIRHLRRTGCARVVLGGSCLEPAAGSTATRSVYAITKRAAHDLAMELSNDDFAAACAHIFWVYGPHEDPRRGIPTVIRSLLENDPVSVTAGAQRREYMHVADVASALRAVLESDLTGRVDLCVGQPVEMRRIFELIGKATSGVDLIRFGARPTTQDDSFEVPSDPAPLRSLGSWTPRRTLESGITETVDWWRDRLSPKGVASDNERRGTYK